MVHPRTILRTCAWLPPEERSVSPKKTVAVLQSSRNSASKNQSDSLPNLDNLSKDFADSYLEARLDHILGNFKLAEQRYAAISQAFDDKWNMNTTALVKAAYHFQKKLSNKKEVILTIQSRIK